MSPPGSSGLLNYLNGLHDTEHTQDYVNSIDDQHVCIKGQLDVCLGDLNVMRGFLLVMTVLLAQLEDCRSKLSSVINQTSAVC